MLTREQIESTLENGISVGGNDPNLKSLCDMALGFLALQPRPIAELPQSEDEVAIGFYKNVPLHVLRYYPFVNEWKTGVFANKTSCTHGILFSALPHPAIQPDGEG